MVSPHSLSQHILETIQVVCACVRACACVYECVLHDPYTSSSYTGQSLTQSFLLSHCLNLHPRQECRNAQTLGRLPMPSTGVRQQVLLTPVLLYRLSASTISHGMHPQSHAGGAPSGWRLMGYVQFSTWFSCHTTSRVKV